MVNLSLLICLYIGYYQGFEIKNKMTQKFTPGHWFLQKV